MLGIIGLVLKVIGIIIGILLAILITVVLLIFLVPIRYKAGFINTDEKLNLDVRVNWLLHFISCNFKLNGKNKRIRISILGIPLYDTDKPKKEKRKKKRKRKKNRKDEVVKSNEESDFSEINAEEKVNEEDKASKIESSEKEISKRETSEREIAEDKFEDLKADTDGTDSREDEEDLGKVEKLINRIKNKIYNLYNGIIQRIKDIFNKIKELFNNLEKLNENINEAKSIIWTEEKKKLYLYSFDILKKMLKHILPRKIKGNIIFGTGDPYSTGQILTYSGMFYGTYGQVFNVSADFDDKRLESDIKVKGKIHLISISIFLLKLFNKRFRAAIKDVRNIKNVFGKI